ncbi:MAG: SDR family oxidoreductase [Armatimonadetes bacterium]|nr:SDR family oxidoreductase [Armatimonadota bacterium]
MNIENSRILITGGAHGLGRRFALDLSALGARVGVCDLDVAGLEKLCTKAEPQGATLWSRRTDVSVEPEVEDLFRHFAADFGGIDCVVNNAGITRDGLLVKNREGNLERFPLAAWQKVLDVNLTGVFLCGREAAYHMVAQGTGGLIISMSSVNRVGVVGQTNYSATKAGVAAMTEVWARELSRYHIRATAIAPGYVRGEMTNAVPEKTLQRIIDRTPLGRLADEEEISHALRFVIENDFITGRVIEVDGGLR